MKKLYPGWIYILKGNGLYKIGRAKQIEGRINTYRPESHLATGIAQLLKLGLIEKISEGKSPCTYKYLQSGRKIRD